MNNISKRVPKVFKSDARRRSKTEATLDEKTEATLDERGGGGPLNGGALNGNHQKTFNRNNTSHLGQDEQDSKGRMVLDGKQRSGSSLDSRGFESTPVKETKKIVKHVDDSGMI